MLKWKLEDRDKPVVFALLALALVLVALPFLPRPQPQTNDAADEKTEDFPILGVIEAAATFVIAVYAVSQYREGKKSSERQLRAYLSLTPAKLQILADDKTMVFAIKVENHGQTPAFDVQIFSEARVLEYPLLRRFRFQKGWTANKPTPTFVCHPGGTHWNAPRKALTNEELAAIDAEKSALYVLGVAHFVDAFGKRQWSEFCAYLTKDRIEIDCAEAIASPGRKAVPAAYRFTQFNNTASRAGGPEESKYT